MIRFYIFSLIFLLLLPECNAQLSRSRGQSSPTRQSSSNSNLCNPIEIRLNDLDLVRTISDRDISYRHFTHGVILKFPASGAKREIKLRFTSSGSGSSYILPVRDAGSAAAGTVLDGVTVEIRHGRGEVDYLSSLQILNGYSKVYTNPEIYFTPVIVFQNNLIGLQNEFKWLASNRGKFMGIDATCYVYEDFASGEY